MQTTELVTAFLCRCFFLSFSVHKGEPGERRVDGMEAGGVLRNPKERRPNDFCGISKVR